MIKYTCVPSLNKTAAKCLMLLGLLMAGGQSAYAACYVNNGYKAQVINMNLGRVLVTPSSGLGILWSPLSSRLTRSLGMAVVLMAATRLGRSSVAARRASAMCGVPIFRIGIRLYREAGSISTYYPHTLRLNGNIAVNLNGGYFKIDIVKTAAQTGSGQLVPGKYTTYYMDGSGRNLPMLESIVDANSLTIVTSTCNVDSGSKNKVVNLDTVTAASFGGVGSTQGEKAFDININCVGGIGEDLLPGNARQGIVNVRFDYTQDASNALA